MPRDTNTIIIKREERILRVLESQCRRAKTLTGPGAQQSLSPPSNIITVLQHMGQPVRGESVVSQGLDWMISCMSFSGDERGQAYFEQ